MVLQFHFKYAFQLCKILEVESPLEIKYIIFSMAHQKPIQMIQWEASAASWISNSFKNIHFFMNPRGKFVVSFVTVHAVILKKLKM